MLEVLFGHKFLVFTISVEVLQVGGASRLHIDEAGVHMLLRKIVESRKDGLSVFQKQRNKTVSLNILAV